jgi:SAM-dependent methyltransferase
MKDVDYHDDVQNMSHRDGSYDCVVISRVLAIPRDLDSSVRELRRILKQGGVAVIAENCAREKTEEFGKTINDRARIIGIDILELYRKHFARVDVYLSDRYSDEYHLTNSICLEGKPVDGYPELIRVPGEGHMELVAVCHA